MCTNYVLVGFNHPLQGLPDVDHARIMPICDVSSQDACYCSSWKINKNLPSCLVWPWHVLCWFCWRWAVGCYQFSSPLCKIVDFLPLWTLIICSLAHYSDGVIGILHNSLCSMCRAAVMGVKCECCVAEHTGLGFWAHISKCRQINIVLIVIM